MHLYILIHGTVANLYCILFMNKIMYSKLSLLKSPYFQTFLIFSDRWEKCMKQLAGHENRPGQLGNTGQIVLNTCDEV